jgi:hypothetical protein
LPVGGDLHLVAEADVVLHVLARHTDVVGDLVDVIAVLGAGEDTGPAQPVNGRVVCVFRIDVPFVLPGLRSKPRSECAVPRESVWRPGVDGPCAPEGSRENIPTSNNRSDPGRFGAPFLYQRCAHAHVIITQTGASERAVQHRHSDIHPGWVNHYLQRRVRQGDSIT